MQGTPRTCKVNHVIVGGQQHRQIQIPSYILWTSHAQDIYTQTFIDCRANINCIDYEFARRNRIPLKKLEKPLLVNNVDRSPNEAGTIKHSVILFIRMGGIIHKEEFHTIKCGKDNIILGLPWLNHVNPTINWVNKHVDIHEATDQTEEYNLATSNKPFTIRKATEEPLTHPELLHPVYASPIQRVISWLYCDNWNATVLKKNFADLQSSSLLEKKKLAPSDLLLSASCATVLTIVDFPIPAKLSSTYIWDWPLCKLLHHKCISFETSDCVPSKQVGCAWLV